MYLFIYVFIYLLKVCKKTGEGWRQGNVTSKIDTAEKTSFSWQKQKIYFF